MNEEESPLSSSSSSSELTIDDIIDGDFPPFTSPSTARRRPDESFDSYDVDTGKESGSTDEDEEELRNTLEDEIGDDVGHVLSTSWSEGLSVRYVQYEDHPDDDAGPFFRISVSYLHRFVPEISISVAKLV